MRERSVILRVAARLAARPRPKVPLGLDADDRCDMPPALLSGERLSDKGFGVRVPGRPGPPRPDAEFVISFHGAPTRKLSSWQSSQRIVAFTKFRATCAPLPRTLLFLDFLPFRTPSKVRLLSCLSNRAVLVNAFLASIYTSPLRTHLSGARRSHAMASCAQWWSMHFYGLGLKPAPCWPKRSRSAPSSQAVSSKLARQDNGFHSGPRHHHGRLSAVADSVKNCRRYG